MSLIFAMLLVSAQTPTAQQPVSAAPVAAPKKVKEKKICRVDDPESGSHMSKRVCRTASEWDMVDQGVNLSGRPIQTEMPEQH